MSDGIYLLQDDGQLIEMTEQAYDSEALLQKLLEDHPSLLAGSQLDTIEPRRWLLISREMPVPLDENSTVQAAVDHLFLDQDGIPTLVEVKRSSDTRIRREVIGQMIDYAANAVVYWPLSEIQTRFEALCDDRGIDPEQELSGFLGPESSVEKFWQAVKTNLKAGKVRLVFVADQIPTKLQRAVEFLNEQMDPAEVVAIEIKQYVGQNLRTLVPRLIGQTAEAQQKKTAAREKRQWDATSFFQELERRRGSEDANATRKILEWAISRVSYVWWGEGSRTGSFVPILLHTDQKHQLFATYTYGTLEIYFQWYQYKPPFDSEEKRLALRDKLNAIEGISIPKEAIARRPSIRLSILQDETVLKQFLAVFEWVIQEIKAT